MLQLCSSGLHRRASSIYSGWHPLNLIAKGKEVGRVISEEPHPQSFHTYLHPLKCVFLTSIFFSFSFLAFLASLGYAFLSASTALLLSWHSAIHVALEGSHPLKWVGVGLYFAFSANVGLASFPWFLLRRMAGR